MARLFLIRHAQSIVDTVVATMCCDPLYQVFQEILQEDLPTETKQTVAQELHLRHCLPCSINDAKLSPESDGQIKLLGHFLETVRAQPRKVWCSPLTRARATLERLNIIYPMLTGCATILDNRLIERQRGDDAGKFADLRIYLVLNQHEHLRKLGCQPLTYAPPGGESLQGVRERASLVLREILPESRNNDVVVFTHHTVICSLRGQLEQWPESAFLKKLVGDRAPNCGVLQYSVVGGDVKLVQRSW